MHVHLFSRVLTGESYVKSHVFPFESMLLEDAYYCDRIRVTSKPAELVSFTLRMFVKYGSLLDLLVLWRKSEGLRTEVRWLEDSGDLSEALSLLRTHCPVVEEELFIQCVATLDSDAPIVRRFALAQRVAGGSRCTPSIPPSGDSWPMAGWYGPRYAGAWGRSRRTRYCRPGELSSRLSVLMQPENPRSSQRPGAG